MTLLPQMIVPPGGVPIDAVYQADLASRLQQLEAIRTKIGAGSINAGVLAAGTITGSLIEAGTITSSLIAANAINAGHIQAGVITSTHIAANTITAGNIAASTITSTEIAAATIQAADIAAHTITANEIAASTITTNELAANTITAADIAAGTITGDRIAGGTITGSLIASTTITGSNLVSATITADKLSVSTLSAVSADMGTLTAGKVQVGAAGGAKVAIGSAISTSSGAKDGVVGTDSGNAITFWMDSATGNLQLKGTILSGSSGLGNISGTINGGTNIAPTTITGDRMVADTITATQIAASAITASELAANAVTAGHIQAGAITTVKLDAGAVTADKVSVAALSAISADLGSVAAGTVTGVTIQTATAGGRVVLDASGLTAYAADGVTASVVLPTSGDALFRGSVDAEGGVTFSAPISAPPPGSKKASWLDVNEAEVASVFGITNTYPGSTNQALVASATGPLSYTTLVKNHANLKHYWKLNGGTSPSTTDSAPTSPKNLTVYTATGGVAPASTGGLIAGTDQAIQTNYQGRGWYGGTPAAAENVTTGWSVEYWIKIGSKPLNDVRLVSRSTTNDMLGTEYWKSTFKAATGKLEASIRIGAAAKIQTTTTVLALNTTYHVVHTYDGANIKTYLNGAADGASTAQTGSIDAQGTAFYNAGIIASSEEDYHQGGGTGTDGGNKSTEFSSWANLANVASSNNTYVTATYPGTNPAGGAFSPELHVATWGMAIPTGATIRGIQVWIERKAAVNDGSGNTVDVGVFVRKQDGTRSANKSSGSVWQLTDTWKNFGGPLDTWGTTWTPADVNGTNFGAIFQAYVNGAATTLSVDSVEISVYYSTSISLDEVAVYNAALTPTVISDHYQTGVTGISTSAATYERKIIRSDGTSDFMDNKIVSALPGTPYDGQIIAYQSSGMATDGVVWLLRYRAGSASAYKWEYIGGTPLWAGVATGVATTSGTYADLAASTGPDITLPLAGDYSIRHGFTGFGAASTATDIAGMSYAIGATAAVDADAAMASRVNVTTNPRMTVSREQPKLAFAASTLLRAKYRSSGAQSYTFQDRWISVTPVRVG